MYSSDQAPLGAVNRHTRTHKTKQETNPKQKHPRVHYKVISA